ncbi:MAG: peroxiredoxin-like family protein [Methyloceanibacter sp.]|uniref:peroxiredoxin-like family protein n=1 Tax=Methyloceanibacter sp. TaxID=1965321 RepID=UPI003EDF5C4C
MSEVGSVEASVAEAFHRADTLKAPLDERLDLYMEESRKLFPALESAYDDLAARLRENGAGRLVPAVGEALPDVHLTDSEGHLVRLGFFMERGPLVISFNRSPWCGYCGLEFQALARAYPFIASVGGDVVSIVPKLRPQAQALQQKYGLPFSVLTDLDLVYASSLGLVFWAGDTIRQAYETLGIDFSQFQGNDGWLLPIPATLVVGRDGRVRARFVDLDFRNRMNTEDILTAVSEAR